MQDSSKTLLGFGKYKEKSREYVLQNDPNYALWAMKQCDTDGSLRLKAFAEFAKSHFAATGAE